jgi:hypothetical protein
MWDTPGLQESQNARKSRLQELPDSAYAKDPQVRNRTPGRRITAGAPGIPHTPGSPGVRGTRRYRFRLPRPAPS